MRLLCNGVALDLKSGATLSFKKVNPLFAFDDLTCERTQSFQIPSTPKNERIFGLAKIPAFRGEGMRRRFDCELQDGAVVKRGHLYVDKYSKDEYSAVFVTGELVGLQAVKDLGKLKDVISVDDVVQYGGPSITPSVGRLQPWANVSHLRLGGTMHPSSLVRSISSRVVSQQGLSPVTLPDSANGLRIIPAKVNGIAKTETSLSSAIVDARQPLNDEPTTPFNTVAIGGGVDEVFSVAERVVATTRLNVQLWYRYVQIVPLQNIRLTIPREWPVDRYIISFEDDYQDATFLGGRSFTKVWDQPSGRAVLTRTGDPLAGRTVDIPRGTPFSFVTEGEYDCSRVVFQQALYTIGWNFSSYNYPITLEGTDMSAGDVVRMQDNLPDVTYVELLKTVAAVTGKVLNYTDKDGVTFDDLSFDGWPIVDVTGKEIGEDEVNRRFGDYAQKNVVRFEPSELIVSPVRVEYDIDNNNIEAEKDLQVVPFSEGGVRYGADGVALLMVNADGEAYVEDKDIIADSGSPSKLIQCPLRKNEGLQALCDMSTSIVLKVRTSLMEFEALTAKTLVLFRGTRYVWTEANWSKEVATLKLSAVRP